MALAGREVLSGLPNISLIGWARLTERPLASGRTKKMVRRFRRLIVIRVTRSIKKLNE